MRNSRRRRDISLVIATIAVATLFSTATQPQGDTLDDVWFGVVIASFMVTVTSAIAWGIFQLATSRQSKLVRGDDRLAQWDVSATEWEQFLLAEEIRKNAGRKNTINAHKLDASSGIDVVISKQSLMVGDDFYHLAEQVGLQWLPEQPPCLEFNMVTVTKGGRIHWNIRFPTAASAEPQARVVWDYMHASRPRENGARLYRLRVRIRKIALICIPPSTMALLFAYVFFGNESMKVPVLVCTVVGFPVLLVSLLLAAILHSLIRSQPLPDSAQEDQ